MAEVFPPTRGEPFFETIPGSDINQAQITVRWSTYLDNIGNSVNATSEEINEQVSGLESEIGKIASLQSELTKDISQIDELLGNVSSVSSKLIQLQRSIDEVMSLINEKYNERALIAELTKRINNLEQLI